MTGHRLRLSGSQAVVEMQNSPEGTYRLEPQLAGCFHGVVNRDTVDRFRRAQKQTQSHDTGLGEPEGLLPRSRSVTNSMSRRAHQGRSTRRRDQVLDGYPWLVR